MNVGHIQFAFLFCVVPSRRTRDNVTVTLFYSFMLTESCQSDVATFRPMELHEVFPAVAVFTVISTVT